MVGKSSGADTKTINLAARNQTGQLIFCQGRALYRLPGFCRDLSCPVILSGIFLHRLQERLTDRIHENTPFHAKSTSHF